MGRQNIAIQEKKPPSPLLPISGFILMVAVCGLAWLASPRMVLWLKSTQFSLAGLLKVLPIEFPKGWSAVTNQLVVTAFLSILVFTLVMSVLFFFMKVPGTNETDVSLDTIRQEKKKMMKRR
jgi:hypothetical protein